MLVNEMSSLTSPLGHSSKYSENRSGNENRTNLANHSRTDLLCLRSKHIASYHSPAGPLQCTDTRISFITIFSVVVSLRAKLRKKPKIRMSRKLHWLSRFAGTCHAKFKNIVLLSVFFFTCLFNKTMDTVLRPQLFLKAFSLSCRG